MIFLSKELFFLDTSVLIALSNINPTEDVFRKKAEAFLNSGRAYSVHTTLPCMVEFLYRTKKSRKMSPKDVRTNLTHYGVTPMSTSETYSNEILDKYLSINYKNAFDFADFYLCSVAFQFPKSAILTTDSRDLPLAYSKSFELFPQWSKNKSSLELCR